LPIDRSEYGAGTAVEAVRRIGVANLQHRIPHQVRNVDIGGCGNFAGHDRHAGSDQRFAGHPSVLVVRQDSVEHRIGNLVRDLVRMAFGD
jgi:hypothetical protein